MYTIIYACVCVCVRSRRSAQQDAYVHIRTRTHAYARRTPSSLLLPPLVVSTEFSLCVPPALFATTAAVSLCVSFRISSSLASAQLSAFSRAHYVAAAGYSLSWFFFSRFSIILPPLSVERVNFFTFLVYKNIVFCR